MPGTQRCHILSLTGGGFLGLYTACVLAELEHRAGEPLGRRFDLLAGTSIGGILAIALAFEVPMAEVREAFARRGREIFTAREVPRTRLARLRQAWSGFASPRYRLDPLAAILGDLLGDRTLAEAKHPVLVPAINLTRGETRLFRTPHHPRFGADADCRAVDAALATAAAPLFFPLARIGGDLMMDAGVYVDSPDILALHEAEIFLGHKREDMRMLSVGTMTADFAAPPTTPAAVGALGWMKEPRLIYTILSAQQHLTCTMAREALGNRYLRIDRANPEATWRVIDLDAAGPNAVRALLDIGACAAQEELANPALAAFLAPRP